ncbi:MAG: helix-turn-helix transcriptional regulator [Vulcanimicrobiaceae bacterium]
MSSHRRLPSSDRPDEGRPSEKSRKQDGNIGPAGDLVSDRFYHKSKDPEYAAIAEMYRVAEDVARLLICYRMEHDLKQKQLAEQLGMTESMVSRLESGQHTPNLKTLCRLMVLFRKRILFEESESAAELATAL